MRNVRALALGLLLAGPWAGTRMAAQPGCLAIRNVSVIPLDRERIVTGQTVLIRGERIVRVAPAAEVKVPAPCTVVDGRHRYLMPGLVDSHLHLPLRGRADQQLVLAMLLANGVTGGINMEGSPEILSLRNDLRAGKLDGPTLYTTGIFIQQPQFMDAEQVRREVAAEKAAGYDFVKVHGELSKEAYDAVFATAKAEGIRVVGHVPDNLGIDAALGRQSLIVHAEEFLYSYFQFQRELPTDPAEIDRMVREVSKKVAASGTWVSPTLSVFRQIIFQAADVDALLQRPEMRFMPRHLTTGAAVAAPTFAWYPPDNPYVKRWPPERIPHLREEYALMQKLVAGLRDAGVPLLAGTDPFVPCVIPGFSMREELEQLYEAGLTPYQVLESATANAARFLGASDQWGTVTAGRRADLLLLNANPLEDVNNTSLQEGIVLHGKWFSKDELQQRLEQAVKQSAAGATP